MSDSREKESMAPSSNLLDLDLIDSWYLIAIVDILNSRSSYVELSLSFISFHYLFVSLCRYCKFLIRWRKTREKASFSIPEITAMVYSPQVSRATSPCRRSPFGTEKALCSFTETTGFSDVVNGHEEGSGVQEPLWLLYGCGNDVSPEAHVSGHVAVLERGSGHVDKAHNHPRTSSCLRVIVEGYCASLQDQMETI